MDSAIPASSGLRGIGTRSVQDGIPAEDRGNEDDFQPSVGSLKKKGEANRPPPLEANLSADAR